MVKARPATDVEDFREHFHRPGAVVELSAAVVADVDAVDAHGACAGGVFGGGDALQDELDGVLVAETGNVVP